jgi:purine-nucleoside phosphorylase
MHEPSRHDTFLRMSNSTPSTNPYALAEQAATELRLRTGVDHYQSVVVLGSGWREAADRLHDGADEIGPEVTMSDLPGFPAPSAMGHGATMRTIRRGSQHILVLLGRVHLYEGHDPAIVVHGIRTAAAAGARIALLTNGAGCLRREWNVGQPVLISDHINLTGRSPLTGNNPPSPHAGRFVDLTNAYSPRLRSVARTVDASLVEGVYLGLHGPHFETPAEIRMGATMGADLVGMSTVLETIAARHLGMEVLGLSLATNLAAGISDKPLSGEEVMEAGAAAAPRIGALLTRIVDALA